VSRAADSFGRLAGRLGSATKERTSNMTRSRTRIHGKGWKKATTIATDKYAVISRAIMASLSKKPITYSELVKRVKAKLKSFDGSIPWYTITCLRELETQDKVTRSQKPVLYSIKMPR
jgi:hypothetical protein